MSLPYLPPSSIVAPTLESILSVISLDPLLCRLSFRDLYSLALVSRICASQVANFHMRAFKYHNVLVPFFNPMQIPFFQQLQAHTGTLVAGSVTSKFFTCKTYDSDLDLFCSFSSANSVGLWLLDNGFVFCPTDNQRSVFSADYTRVLSSPHRSVSSAQQTSAPPSSALRKHEPTHPRASGYESLEITEVWSFSAADGSKPIQIIATLRSPLAAVLTFHSTCVVNFMSHKAAYSLFPKLSFWEGKWSTRGFALIPCPNPARVLSATSDLSLSSTWWVGDRNCWVVHFKYAPGGLPPPDHLRLNSWKIFYSTHGTHLSFSSTTLNDALDSTQLLLSESEVASIRSIANHFRPKAASCSTLLSCLQNYCFPGHNTNPRALSITKQIFNRFATQGPPHLGSLSLHVCYILLSFLTLVTIVHV
ncbi:hypothetical protein GYMLUDRAFT_249810 [Collybiopsis luxurians FD-317 M1]|uniref:Unplaced genomic scaffold GYMLUscaffold_72, whole genome shotgun sequence n=1 Tax=Collybiopsis luxurians FD-317 M1 TaxID=944289 RepID=A0A0D0BWI8_9AGAR|nr:hypothetical protein GYMLUDRAFT_249810 [Collybiopsis luxurians FD-317 M1]